VPSISFPGQIYAGMPTTITVGIDHPSQLAAGFNLRMNNGAFDANPGTGARRLSTGEATHSAPNAGLPATWVLTWTPATSGSAEYQLWGNAVNLNGANSGDSPAAGISTGVVTVLLRPDGMACTQANQCDSGFCAGGFCCASACDGECESCDTGVCEVAEPEPITGPTACCQPGFRWTGTLCEATDTCGDGTVDANEACDDGALNGEPTSCCSLTCELVEGCCNVDQDCDDGNACTTNTCSGPAGTCTPSPIAGCCLEDSDCPTSTCTIASCDLDSNLCESTPVPNCCTSNADCEDADPCTITACLVELGECSFEVVEMCGTPDPDPEPDPNPNPDPNPGPQPTDEGCGCANAGASHSGLIFLLGLIGLRLFGRRGVQRY